MNKLELRLWACKLQDLLTLLNESSPYIILNNLVNLVFLSIPAFPIKSQQEGNEGNEPQPEPL